MRILVINAGSSSVKVALLDEEDAVLLAEELPAMGAGDTRAIGELVDRALPLEVVAHRVVHGGARFSAATVIDSSMEDELDALTELAPLHNPLAVALIRSILATHPHLTQVACFDTAFHRDLPKKAMTYAIPEEWTTTWGLRRYGFHGLSHAWASRRVAALLGTSLDELRTVSAHIGSGASLAAVLGGRSIDTTMGFTPIEGLVMATRSGSIDPGAIVWLLRHGAMTVDALEEALERRSGLLGMTGVSDLREVITRMDRGDERAALGYAVYTLRLRQQIASMVASMQGLDALVFTGGAGAGSARLRADTCAGLGFLGIDIERVRNEQVGGDDAIVSEADSGVAVAVVHAREDLEIARQVRALLA